MSRSERRLERRPARREQRVPAAVCRAARRRGRHGCRARTHGMVAGSRTTSAPASFFPPADGLGSPSASDTAAVESFLDGLASRLSQALARLHPRAHRRESGLALISRASSSAGVASGRMRPLTVDRLSHRHQGHRSERWSIAYSPEPYTSEWAGRDALPGTSPARSPAGRIATELCGSCTQRPRLHRYADDSSSGVPLRICRAATPGDSTARDCAARNAWRPMDDARLRASSCPADCRRRFQSDPRS